MQYPYPDEFPQKSRSRVLGERIRAARDFDLAKQEARDLSEIEGLLRNYILRVFMVFVREARHLGCQGLWSADRLESESRNFLRQFTIRARYEKAYDRSGSRMPEMVSHWDGSILPEIQCAFEQSPEWQEFQDILLEVADVQPSLPKDESQLEASISEGASTGKAGIYWENINISFLSDERVQVEVGRQVETRNYVEMGFEDKRSGKPNQAWGLLRALAVAGGVIPNAARNSKDFIAMMKRIERMRETLRRHFGISSDPIPLDANQGYCCRFHITCASSFEK
jgi:hypothetical protein